MTSPPLMNRISLSYEETKDYIDRLIKQLQEDYGMSVPEIDMFTGDHFERTTALKEMSGKMVDFLKEYKFLLDSYKREAQEKEEAKRELHKCQSLLEGKLVELEDMFNSMRMTEELIGEFEVELVEKDQKITSLTEKIEKIQADFAELKRDHESILEKYRSPQEDSDSEESFRMFKPTPANNNSAYLGVSLAEEIFEVAEKSIMEKSIRIPEEHATVEKIKLQIPEKKTEKNCYTMSENLGFLWRDFCKNWRENFRDYLLYSIFLILMIISHIETGPKAKLSNHQIDKVNYPDQSQDPLRYLLFFRYRQPSKTLT